MKKKKEPLAKKDCWTGTEVCFKKPRRNTKRSNERSWGRTGDSLLKTEMNQPRSNLKQKEEKNKREKKKSEELRRRVLIKRFWTNAPHGQWKKTNGREWRKSRKGKQQKCNHLNGNRRTAVASGEST